MAVTITGGESFNTAIKAVDGFSGVTKISFCTDSPTDSATVIDGTVKAWIDGTTLKVSGGEDITTNNLKRMFSGCANITSIGFTALKPADVTDASFMFDGCSGLTELDLSTLDVNSNTWYGYMFNGCTALKTLNIRNWAPARFDDVQYMFNKCSALTTVYASQSWEIGSGIGGYDSVFSGCTSLPNWTEEKVDGSYAKSTEEGGYFTVSEPTPQGGRLAQLIQTLYDALQDSKVALTEKEVTPPEDLKFSGIDEEIDKVGE